MSSTIVYFYAMTYDGGTSPCIDDGVFSLACCKGGKPGLRRVAANCQKAGNTVYVVGLCGIALANKVKKPQISLAPVFFAKINEVIPMTEYFAENGRAQQSHADPERGRKDNAYTVINGKLENKGEGWPHGINEKTGKPDTDAQTRDINGEYVLLSEQFTYWGDACGESGSEIQQAFNEVFVKGIEIGHRKQIVPTEEFESLVKTWSWFPKDETKCNLIGKCFISNDVPLRKRTGP